MSLKSYLWVLFAFTLLFLLTSKIQAIPVAAVIINEINGDPSEDANGDGLLNTSQDEFVEIVNNSAESLILDGWSLHDATGERHRFPAGTTIPAQCALVVFGGGTPQGSFGNSIVQIAGQLGLNNTGDTITLYDTTSQPVVSVSYGAEGGNDQSLTRSPDLTGNFVPHTTVSSAKQSPGTKIDGTPFSADCARADLVAKNEGVTTAKIGDYSYRISVANVGNTAAEEVVLIDQLPQGISYLSDTSGITPEQSSADTWRWQIGTLEANTTFSFTLSVTPTEKLNRTVTNLITVTTTTAELSADNNSDSHATLVGDVVLINALHYYALENNSDEAIQLINVSDFSADLSGWQIGDGSSFATLPPNTSIAPRQTLWIADDATAFARQFGFSADLTAIDLIGSWPSYSNSGDEAQLNDPYGNLVDLLVYDGDPRNLTGWNGDPLQPYRGGTLPIAGQILYRKKDQRTGLPVPDTNSAKDWAQELSDLINGRKVMYPGWDLDRFFFTKQVTETASLIIAINPDNGYQTLKKEIDSAESTIVVETHTFENFALMQAMIAAVQRGVAVDILLEGSPPGGIADEERYLCQQLEEAGGNCWFVINDNAANIYDRYPYMHAKFMIIDGKRATIASDNFSPRSYPYDDLSDGTSGSRGILLATDAPGVVERLQAIWSADFDPTHHREIFAWTANDPTYANRYGLPTEGFLFNETVGGITYTVRYSEPLTIQGTIPFEVIQSPENSLRDVDGLLGLIGRAKTGDTLQIQQLNEPPSWGDKNSSAALDPNVRLEAYINAARRGAKVWVMLDQYHALEYYDPTDPPANETTCLYLQQIARTEQLFLRCMLAMPADLGIHNKMILAQIDGKGYVNVGSINGSQHSSKANREVALQFQSDEAYNLLTKMFIADWPHKQYLPILMMDWKTPVKYPIISEVLYDPAGTDDGYEYVEIANPSIEPIDLSNWSISDALTQFDYEDLRLFPMGTILPPLGTIVVTTRADLFFERFGVKPNYEIMNGDLDIPDLIDDPAWGENTFKLGNSGDEVILRNPQGVTVDAVSYGTGDYPNVIAAPTLLSSDKVLERFPFAEDSDNCLKDFREASPSPGVLHR